MSTILTDKSINNSNSNNSNNTSSSIIANAVGDVDSISKLLRSTGPVVLAVMLRADGSTTQVSMDTTPQRQMAAQLLGGGPVTFLGQYHEEGIVLMIRNNNDNNNDDLPPNQHKLQPPFTNHQVRGDILVLKVADCDDNAVVLSNDDFFLNYSVDDYVQFAARTDVQVPHPPCAQDEEEASNEGEEEEEEEESEEEEEEEEGEDDSEEEEEGGFLAMLMGQVLQKFQQENGRLPTEEELAALQGAIVAKMGGMGM